MDTSQLLNTIDISLQSSDVKGLKELQSRIKNIIVELNDRLNYVNRELEDGENETSDEKIILTPVKYPKSKKVVKPEMFYENTSLKEPPPVSELKKLTSFQMMHIPDKEGVKLKGLSYKNNINIQPGVIYLDEESHRFYINIYDTIIEGELSSILVPGKDQLFKCTPCKRCIPGTTPEEIIKECNYYHNGDRRNLTTDYLRPPQHHNYFHNHFHKNHSYTPNSYLPRNYYENNTEKGSSDFSKYGYNKFSTNSSYRANPTHKRVYNTSYIPNESNDSYEDNKQFRYIGSHKSSYMNKSYKPSSNYHCKYFGCAIHIDDEIKNMKKDDFYILRQLLLNIYIYYAATIQNRPDLVEVE